MSNRESSDRRTLYCGNLHENVTEELLFELFLQVRILLVQFFKMKSFFSLLEWSSRKSNTETRWSSFICFY